jgi:S-adenosylmethionine/arginine decarboxylase-like enzyme
LLHKKSIFDEKIEKLNDTKIKPLKKRSKNNRKRKLFMTKYVLLFASVFSLSFFSLQANDTPAKAKIVISQSSQAADDAIVDQYNECSPWGMNIAIDIYGCDEEMIKDEDLVKQFLQELVVFIDMKAYGEPVIKNFGPSPRLFGISAVQLIETSNITAHFSPVCKAAHIDIFSCKSFRPHAAGIFCKQFFKANELMISPPTFRY